jgi:hypothetical protein
VDLHQAPKRSSRRPDLSTFYATVNETYGDEQAHNNPHTLPTPENVTATFRLGADVYETILNDHGDDNPLLRGMIELLDSLAGAPPTKLEGVSNAFLDELERVPRKELKKDDCCPICSEPFLEGGYIATPSSAGKIACAHKCHYAIIYCDQMC